MLQKKSSAHFFSLWQPTLALCISIFAHRAICPRLVYLAILKWNKLCIHPASYMLIYAFDLVLVTVELILSQGSKVRFPPWISIRPSRGTVGAFMHFTGPLPGGEWSQSECVVCGAFRPIVLIFPMARLSDCWKWRRGSALIIRLRAMSMYFSCTDIHISPFEFP